MTDVGSLANIFFDTNPVTSPQFLICKMVLGILNSKIVIYTSINLRGEKQHLIQRTVVRFN